MKKENKILLSFLCGIFAVSTAIPILEELTNLILTWIEYLKIVPSKKIAIGNKDLQDIIGNSEEYNEESYAIGFEIPNKSEENDDYYDE